MLEICKRKCAQENMSDILQCRHQGAPIHGLAIMMILPVGFMQRHTMSHIERVLKLFVLIKVQHELGMRMQLHERILGQNLTFQWRMGALGEQREVQIATVTGSAIAIELWRQLEVQWLIELRIGTDGNVACGTRHQTEVI